MPILKDDLLLQYIQDKSTQYQFSVDKQLLKQVMETYGGILQLTKEYLRAREELGTLELKLRIIWGCLPKSYQQVIENQISTNSTKIKSLAGKDLTEMGVKDLKVFKEHRRVLNQNPNYLLPKLLTPEELKLWKYCETHPKELVGKDQLIEIIRTENSDEVSFWAIDQAVSRFRKKLARAGIDPELFKTVKGKGYIWTG